MQTANLKAKYPTLDSLLAAMQSGELSGEDASWVDLPTYGGEKPSYMGGVWSWDETRLLMGEDPYDVAIFYRNPWRDNGQFL